MRIRGLHLRVRSIATIALCLSTVYVPLSVCAQSTSTAAARVKKSTAIIARYDRPDHLASTGTGFCIFSDAHQSWFLTDRHVVEKAAELKIIAPPNIRKQTPAIVDVIGAGATDLAVLTAPLPNCATVSFDLRAPSQTDIVGFSGYPGRHIAQAGFFGIDASLGSGSIDSVTQGGNFLEVQGPVEVGESGGPIFDPTTGGIIGIIESIPTSGMFLAMSANQIIIPFLKNNKLRYTVTAAPAIATSSGEWALQGSPAGYIQFGGGSYCLYETDMIIRSMSMTIVGSTVQNAALKSRMKETAQAHCPYSPLPETDESFEFTDGTVSGSTIDLAFKGRIDNVALSNATFHGDIRDDSIIGDVTFRRIDSSQPFNWTINVKARLNKR